ncbi:MAG: HDOD domain-containing protein [Oligoflexia bacterium]|nr:HDOD domain-containing protein [Oligoflexia bacterium]
MGVRAQKKKAGSDYSRLLEKLQDIRTLPMVAMKVNELINDPNSSGADIADVLKKDQVLTAKILRLVNSSYYAIPGGVADVQRALAFLGFNTLAQLVLSLSVFNFFAPVEGENFSIMEFWRHALATAVCSEILARRLKLAKPEEAFTCGLLHDVGKLVLNEIDPDRLVEIVRESSSRKCSFIEIEREWDMPTHSFMGEAVATKWGLPQIIRQAIRYHHHDVSNMSTILPSSKSMIQIVRLANAICIHANVGHSGDFSNGEITAEMLKPLGLTAEDVPAVVEKLQVEMEKAGAFLNAYR